MTSISLTEARANLREVVAAAELEPVELTRLGHVAAVVVSPARYGELVAGRGSGTAELGLPLSRQRQAKGGLSALQRLPAVRPTEETLADLRADRI